MHEGAHHKALNPYTLPENKGLRMNYPEGMCKGSLEILNRTVMVATNPLHSAQEVEDIIHNIDQAARVALEDAALDDVVIRNAQPVDLQKFDA
jgi:DNA helicase TIP49 (TBP-interacting protein)